MPRYGIATILEEFPAGSEISPIHQPLHLTHVDSFEIEGEISAFIARLRDYLDGQKAISVKIVSDELLGPNKDIPVVMLERSKELMELHSKLMLFFEQEHAKLKRPHFHGKYFKPHVTANSENRLQVGDTVVIDSISIAGTVNDSPDANSRILAIILFS